MAGFARAVAAALRRFLQLSSNGELPIVKPDIRLSRAMEDKEGVMEEGEGTLCRWDETVESVERRPVDNLIWMIYQHFFTCIESINHDSTHVTESNLKDWPSVPGSPFLTHGSMILSSDTGSLHQKIHPQGQEDDQI